MRIHCCFLAGMTALLLAGCGGNTQPGLPDTAPVSGIVTLDGAPLAGAAVQFASVSSTSGTDSFGTTDATGKYQLKQLHGTSGAPAGEYKVVISRLTGPGGKPVQTGPGAPPPIDQGAMESLPPRYSNLLQTELKAVVPAEGTEINFDLKSK